MENIPIFQVGEDIEASAIPLPFAGDQTKEMDEPEQGDKLFLNTPNALLKS